MSLVNEITFYRRWIVSVADHLTTQLELVRLQEEAGVNAARIAFDNLQRRVAMETISVLPAPGLEIVYVLRLKEDKYYVGYTADMKERMYKHFTGTGAKWTQKYPPVEIAEFGPGDFRAEHTKTLEVMRRKGWRNTRGSCWTHVTLSECPYPLREEQSVQ